MDFLTQYGLFLLEALTLAAVVALLIRALRPADAFSQVGSGTLSVTRLDRYFERLTRSIDDVTQAPKALKKARKARRKALKTEDDTGKARIFVLTFKGDIRASQSYALRQEISAVIGAHREGDSVLLRLESPGGSVTGYGLAASQLARLRQAKIPLVVAVDQVAASGGYMMACVADEIIAAPFAILGSIGVVSTIPNINRALKAAKVDVELLTAGEFKRTLTVLGENTEDGRVKAQEQLEEIHGHFKQFVTRYRPDLDIDQVATGEYWQGKRALDLGLVDTLTTSDDWLLARREDAILLDVKWQTPKTMKGRLRGLLKAVVRDSIDATGQAELESRLP